MRRQTRDGGLLLQGFMLFSAKGRLAVAWKKVQRRQMSARLTVWTTQYLRRRCGKCRHPWLEKPQPKSERVFADENKIDELKHGELVEKDASHNRHDEVAQLRHDQHQILDAQNLGADYAANSDGWNPKRKDVISLCSFVDNCHQ